MKHQLIDREYPLRIQLLRWARHVSLSIYKRFFRVLWSRICACSCGARYRRLLVEVSEARAASISSANLHADINALPGCMHTDDASSDEMVSLKVSLLGDCHVGKTSFMVCAILACWYQLLVKDWYNILVFGNSCMPVLSNFSFIYLFIIIVFL